ncbi:hypothetical protein PIIN_01242 [Serendipita indica DSM 11827]|uniref:Uncharacterized protein n=1 Tax=Serendipita indica (strain DSM 11827) TaxID=1109443 RepID=G4T7V1_SERID|nr:hypothetical protein PIIN_01242 [Serendipita indica DSM 11827]
MPPIRELSASPSEEAADVPIRPRLPSPLILPPDPSQASRPSIFQTRFAEGRSPSENILVSATSRRSRIRNRAADTSVTSSTHPAPRQPEGLVANSAASSNLLNLLNERNITPTMRNANRGAHPSLSRAAREASPPVQSQEEDTQANDNELRALLGLPTVNPPSPPDAESSEAAAGPSDMNGQSSGEGAMGSSSPKEEQSIQEYACPICFCPQPGLASRSVDTLCAQHVSSRLSKPPKSLLYVLMRPSQRKHAKPNVRSAAPS